MRKILSVLLVLSVMCSLGIIANAAGFDSSKLARSSMYFYDSSTKKWKTVGSYSKEYSNVDFKMFLFLSSDYIADGWGPDLRLQYYDKTKSNYDAVDGFRATVNDKIYSFSRLDQGDKDSYFFGGTVMRAFLNSLSSAVSVTFEIDHTTKDGDSYTATIDQVNIRDLSKLAELGRLFEAANVWDPEVTTDLYSNDKYYNASIQDNPYFDPNAVRANSVDWDDLVGYWTSRNGAHTFEAKASGAYVTTVPVVPRCGDAFIFEDGIIYKFFSNNPSYFTPNLKITMNSSTEIEVYSYQTDATYTLYKRR